MATRKCFIRDLQKNKIYQKGALDNSCFNFKRFSPLMVACANPAYKIEDLYALLERLKSHPQPAKVFCAMNNRREV
jgi:hypothetical protein